MTQSKTYKRKGLKRNPIDKFYTKTEIADLCLGYIRQFLTIGKDDVCIEPSAGDGSFISGIKQLSKNYLFYDIQPEHKEIVQKDYLDIISYDIKKIFHQTGKIHIIGNPPFGRQSSMAIRFIKKSAEFCDTISFILPKSFKKDSLKQKIPKYFHLLFQIDLPEKSFLVDGIEHNVECIFQIWEKKDYQRTNIEKEHPNKFTFIKKSEIDKKLNTKIVSFRRVGVNAGTIDKLYQNKNIQSHYFIEFTNDKTMEENIELLKTVKFNHNNTTGPRSISKQELIKEFNKLLLE